MDRAEIQVRMCLEERKWHPLQIYFSKNTYQINILFICNNLTIYKNNYSPELNTIQKSQTFVVGLPVLLYLFVRSDSLLK